MTSVDREALMKRVSELSDEIEDIDARRAQIKGQLEKAQAEVHITGQYADPDWFRRAKGALRHLGVERAQACRDLGETNRALRALNATSSDNLFRVAVREVVDEATWALIVERHRDLGGGL
jgi:chromosome segregation ATPase